ncbi:hypothetical protein BH23CHL5_BH23CHL5_24170 [soil metagenome]
MHTSNNNMPPLLIQEDEETGPTRGVWILAASFLVAKIALFSVVLLREFSPMSVGLVVLTSWTWVLAGLLLISGPATLAYRLRRVRARKRDLQRSEWIVEGARHYDSWSEVSDGDWRKKLP